MNRFDLPAARRGFTSNLRRLLRVLVPPVLSAALGGCFAVPALFLTGMGTTAYVANDRRPTDTMISDQRIQKTATSRLEGQLGSDIRLDVVSYNRNVLLIGEARSQDVKERAGKIVSGVEDVREVYNELQVADKLGFHSVSNDAALSTEVKARMVGSGFSDPTNVHVSTENGVVYLMGLVTHREADEASRIAASTSGVRRVVRVFEYIPDKTEPVKAATGDGQVKTAQ